jgi:hypothetical protein
MFLANNKNCLTILKIFYLPDSFKNGTQMNAENADINYWLMCKECAG